MISLVCCTLGRRPRELARLLETLGQSDLPKQVILVVQGEIGSEDLLALVGSPAGIVSKVMRTRPGLSAGRNAALPHVKGELVGFPDDDCWYEPTTLERVLEAFRVDDGAEVVCGDLLDESGMPTGPRGISQGLTMVPLRRVPLIASSATMFWRTAAVVRIGGFDERLGLGADTPWVAGEDVEIIARACRSGLRVEYSKGITVRHPATEAGSISELGFRSYGRGYGRAIAIGRLGPVPVVNALFRPMIGMLTTDSEQRRQRRAVALGRAEGLMGRTLG